MRHKYSPDTYCTRCRRPTEENVLSCAACEKEDADKKRNLEADVFEFLTSKANPWDVSVREGMAKKLGSHLWMKGWRR